MRRSRKPFHLIGLVLAVAITTATAPASAMPASVGETVVEVGNVTPISAGEGYAVFSGYDAAARRYRLTVSVCGPHRASPLAGPRSTPGWAGTCGAARS